MPRKDYEARIWLAQDLAAEFAAHLDANPSCREEYREADNRTALVRIWLARRDDRLEMLFPTVYSPAPQDEGFADLVAHLADVEGLICTLKEKGN